MLHRAARVKPGQTILVHGANGGVGGVLIQLAQHAGIRVIGGASPRQHAALSAAGVEPVDYHDPKLADRVRELSPRGVDAVFDNIGGPMMRVSYGLLAPRGAYVCYAIIASVSGTGGLVMPFVKAVSRVLLWNALPNGHRAKFYDLWAGHKSRPATSASTSKKTSDTCHAARRREPEGQHRRALPPRRRGRRADPRRIPHRQRQNNPVAVSGCRCTLWWPSQL
jgi:NADPH:quinone reductase-like Zn-dependent oxidoreductase